MNNYLSAYTFCARGIEVRLATFGWAQAKGTIKQLIRGAMYGYYEYPRLSDTDRAFIDALLDSVN